ncbi:hypothetical protein SNEBB_007666 [Seison nebaliae]|nr:hypothetical protein SNEBB_007666 [Seison nebaliae]
MATKIFDLNGTTKLLPNCTKIACFNGKDPCLIVGTSASNVLLYNPFETTNEKKVVTLNVSGELRCLTSGSFEINKKRDTLFIGTSLGVKAYNVHNNAELFDVDILEGANALCFGRFGSLNNSDNVLCIGSNCALQAVDKEGSDVMWTVCGDIVRTIELIDFQRNRSNQLLCGANDTEIRVFDDEQIVSEITENSSIITLTRINDAIFGYALDNGTIGVYNGTKRLWRVKSKNEISALNAFDINGNRKKELICGWSNGKLDAKDYETGDIVWKEQFDCAIIGITMGDICKENNNQMIIITEDGQMKLWHATVDECVMKETEMEMKQNALVETVSKVSTSRHKNKKNIIIDDDDEDPELEYLSSKQISITPRNVHEEIEFIEKDMDERNLKELKYDNERENDNNLVEKKKVVKSKQNDLSKKIIQNQIEVQKLKDLMQRKQHLLSEINGFQFAVNPTDPNKPINIDKNDEQNAFPADTSLTTSFVIAENSSVNNQYPHIELAIETNNENTIIKTAIIISEGLFDNGESYVIMPLKKYISQRLTIPLYPKKDIKYSLNIRALVGSNVSATAYRVFEITRILPPFSMYYLSDNVDPDNVSVSFVKLTLPDKNVNRFGVWLNQNFISPTDDDEIYIEDSNTINHQFRCLRSENDEETAINGNMGIEEEKYLTFNLDLKGNLIIYCNNIKITSDIIKSLIDEFGIEKINSECYFPRMFKAITEEFTVIEQTKNHQQIINNQFLDKTNEIKMYLIKCEDRRLLAQYKKLPNIYSKIINTNQALIDDYYSRNQTFNKMTKALRTIKQQINCSSDCRYGPERLQVINCCRQALEGLNAKAFIKTIATGEETV